jgi:heat shock protein HtpX
MSSEIFTRERIIRTGQTAGIFLALLGIFLALGIQTLGRGGLLIFGVILGVSLVSGAGLSTARVLRNSAIPIPYSGAPWLYSTTRELSRRAGLGYVPRLYYRPGSEPTAFTLGRADDVAIVVSQGLFERLNDREITGVLAHEIGHIKNNDLGILRISESIRIATTVMAQVGQFIIIFGFPIFLLTGTALPFRFVFLTLAAPVLTLLLHLALMRTREFDADLEAVHLTGDPEGLASALGNLERSGYRWLDLFRPFPGNRQSDLLRTHPATEERIRRLHRMKGGQSLLLPEVRSSSRE